MRIGRLAAAVLGSALLVVGLAPAAHALPENCTITINGHTAASLCTAGTGEHQIRVKFRFANPQLPGDLWFIGEWAAVGVVSSVYIPLGGTVIHQEVGKR